MNTPIFVIRSCIESRRSYLSPCININLYEDKKVVLQWQRSDLKKSSKKIEYHNIFRVYFMSFCRTFNEHLQLDPGILIALVSLVGLSLNMSRTVD